MSALVHAQVLLALGDAHDAKTGHSLAREIGSTIEPVTGALRSFEAQGWAMRAPMPGETIYWHRTGCGEKIAAMLRAVMT